MDQTASLISNLKLMFPNIDKEVIVAIYNDCNKDIERTVEVLCSLSKNNDCAENAPSQGPNLTSAQYQNRVPTTTSFDPPHSPQLVFPSSSVTVPVYFQTLSQNQQTNPPPNVSPKFNVWPKYPGPIQAAVTKFVQTKLHNMNRFEKQQLRSMMQQRVKQYLQNHSQYVNQDTTKILPIYLTDQQKRQFIEQGYLVIDNIVSNNLTNAALRAINWSIGKGIPPERMSFFKLKSFCPELMCSEVMLNLFFNSSAPNVVKALLDNFRFPFISQIALRFPGDLCVSDAVVNNFFGSNVSQGIEFKVSPHWVNLWHVDGFGPLNNGSKKKVKNFSLILGVFLQDVNEEFAGNLTVFPGSHKVLASYINTLGGPQKVFMTNDNDSSIKIKRDEIPLGQPKQIQGKRGSIIVFHPMLAHIVAPNASPQIRYMVYFRLFHRDHFPGTFRMESVANPWLEFDGLKDFIFQNNLHLY